MTLDSTRGSLDGGGSELPVGVREGLGGRGYGYVDEGNGDSRWSEEQP